MDFTGKIVDMNNSYITGKPKVTLELNEREAAGLLYDELHNAEKLSIKIDKFKEKRSLNANNYAWKLLNEIGNIIRRDKDDVYLDMLKRYGQREMISVQSHIPLTGFVKYFDKAGESTLNGKEFTHYFVYKGSSEFDTREMSIFIDGIVDEAKALNIQTETPEEIAKMKSLWGEGE